MRAAVIGAGGAVGGALVARLGADRGYETVFALSRRPSPGSAARVHAVALDIGHEGSIKTAARSIEPPLDLVVIATGMLHEPGRGPERSLRDLDAEALARSFAINTVGPALVLKHFTPLLRRQGRSVVAALSARVGSISDNRLGGWYGYRASKAALNMIVRCAAIELARSRPDAICVALHPGTVDSALSRPFQGHVPPGQLFTPDHAAGCLLTVLAGMRPEDTGLCFGWDGLRIDP
jgi:NAD(P)-dependent dehydrogenase (short-subunit alcohol dehydrogenase family)